MIDTILIEIVLHGDLSRASYLRSKCFSPKFDSKDLAANRSPTLFASVMKYSLLFSTWFYINIYVCIRTFRNLLASFHKLNTREFSGSFDLGERKDKGKRISEGVFQREPLFVREFQIIFYCLGKRYQG